MGDNARVLGGEGFRGFYFLLYYANNMNSIPEYGKIHNTSGNRGQLASENVLSRQQGKISISLEKKLRWHYNCIGLLLMLRTTAPSPCEPGGLHCIWKSTAVDISRLPITTSDFCHFFGVT